MFEERAGYRNGGAVQGQAVDRVVAAPAKVGAVEHRAPVGAQLAHGDRACQRAARRSGCWSSSLRGPP